MQKVRVLVGSQFARIYASFAGYFPGNKFGFGGKTFQKLINDWGRQALSGKYKIEGLDTNFEYEMAQVTLPVLVLSLKADFLAPPKAVTHLVKKLKSARITQHITDDAALNHFNWLKHSEKFVQEISNWLN